MGRNRNPFLFLGDGIPNPPSNCVMTLKSFLDNPQEMFIGAALQFPLVFIVGWWIIPIMLVCGILWRLGGMTGSNKAFRRVGVPLTVCGAASLFGINWPIFLAVPFMIWLAPASYGESSWLFKLFKRITNSQKKADFYTRSILYSWYWATFSIALFFS